MSTGNAVRRALYGKMTGDTTLRGSRSAPRPVLGYSAPDTTRRSTATSPRRTPKVPVHRVLPDLWCADWATPSEPRGSADSRTTCGRSRPSSDGPPDRGDVPTNQSAQDAAEGIQARLDALLTDGAITIAARRSREPSIFAASPTSTTPRRATASSTSTAAACSVSSGSSIHSRGRHATRAAHPEAPARTPRRGQAGSQPQGGRPHGQGSLARRIHPGQRRRPLRPLQRPHRRRNHRGHRRHVVHDGRVPRVRRPGSKTPPSPLRFSRTSPRPRSTRRCSRCGTPAARSPSTSSRTSSLTTSATNPRYSIGTARIFSYNPMTGGVGDPNSFDAAFRNAGTAGLTRGTSGLAIGTT